MTALPEEWWPNTHNADIWFIGELIKKEEVKDDKRKQPEDKLTIGYYLKFELDTASGRLSRGCQARLIDRRPFYVRWK